MWSLVNISSGLARFALAGSSAYGAAKGAVEVLFYQHRVNPKVPIEDVAGAVKELIEQGWQLRR